MKIYDYNILGERQKEVETLQVVFWKAADGYNNHINMDASGMTEYEKLMAIRALQPTKHTVFFVKPGGLDADEKPSVVQVNLKVSYPKPKAHRKAV